MDQAAYIEMDELEGSNWWFVARRQILDSVIKKLIRQKQSRILEIGSGTGGNLAMLASYGEVTAIEMEKLPFDFSINKQIPRVEIFQGYLPDHLGIPETDPFDLVCMLDVLEHIEEDDKSLRTVRKFISSNGKLLLTVPAYQWLWSSHDDFNHHKRRYTKKRLKSDLESAGFTVEKISYFNTLLFPLAAASRLIEKISGTSKASGVGSVSPTTNKILRFIFSLETKLVHYGILQYGLSILAVCSTSKQK